MDKQTIWFSFFEKNIKEIFRTSTAKNEESRRYRYYVSFYTERGGEGEAWAVEIFLEYRIECRAKGKIYRTPPDIGWETYFI